MRGSGSAGRVCCGNHPGPVLPSWAWAGPKVAEGTRDPIPGGVPESTGDFLRGDLRHCFCKLFIDYYVFIDFKIFVNNNFIGLVILKLK